jgi:glycosyltransferase involved in cell wall biosynthesis
LWCYRPHTLATSFRARVPKNVSRRLLVDSFAPGASLFHGLNQRLPSARQRRTVVTFHDLFVITGDFSTPEFRRRFERLARDAARRADHIIAVSEFTASQVRDLLGVPAQRVRVIVHGTRFQPRYAAAVRERLILHVGAIQKRKNIERLVTAFERTPGGWRLAFAGSLGYGAREILDRIEGSRRSADIQVRGYVTDSELEDLYGRASIFAFPSLGEGFGIPVLEAMAREIPVITSDRTSLPEVAGDAALLVNPEDTDALAAALNCLIEREELRADLVRRGLARAAQFSWESAVEKTWALYEELLA